MKKAFKIFGFALLFFIAALFTFYLVKNERLPVGTPSVEADAVANKMLNAMNKAAWDSTQLVSWTFRGDHHYSWNRVENRINIKWGAHEVDLDPETISGTVATNGKVIAGQEAKDLLKTAWDNFNNDSFWLAAPYKVFDPGTTRSIVTCNDGRKGLMVTYTSGGTTPGDSYVWILDENHRPTSVKMWVSIIPIGGIEFSWENYQQLPSGALVAQDHYAYGMVNVELKNIE